MEGPADAVEDAGAEDLDGPAPVRSARRVGADRSRRRRRAVLAAAVVVLAVAVAAAVRQASTPAADGAPLLDGSASAAELFPVLADGASAADFPDASLATALRLAPGTAHRLATFPAAVVWIAQDQDGGVCLLVRELAGEGSSGGSCATAADLARTPLVLPSGTGVSAALAPRGQDTSRLVVDGFAELGAGRSAGLWVDGATAAGVVEAAVDSTATRIVVVPSESHRGSASLPSVTADDLSPYAVVIACLRPARVEVAVDGAGATPTECGGGSIARHLTGAGRELRVHVDAPAGLVWAASVVACTGTPAEPVC